MTDFDRTHRAAAHLCLCMALAIAGLSAVSGCGGKPPKIEPSAPTPAPAPAPMLQVDVSATANANATASAKGLPIVIRIYELKSAGDSAERISTRFTTARPRCLGAI